MGLPFEGPADEVKAHLEALTGIVTDLLTNLMLYLQGEGYTAGALEDKLKAWLIHETETTENLPIEDMLQLYLTSLGYTEASLVAAIKSAATSGELFPPPLGSGFTSFIVTDAGGSNFITSQGNNFGVRATHVQFIVTDAGGSNVITSHGNNFMSKE